MASTIPLENLVVLKGGRAYPLAPGQTKLGTGDYTFLERFLDVTKANLFFAHGVIVVEGDSEALLLPTLARILGTDLTEHGISIVNVGGTGLRRFSRIFQRSDDAAKAPSISVACVVDMDVMPDCAPTILGLVDGDDDQTWESSKRRWRAVRDFANEKTSAEQALEAVRQRLRAADGQSVRTFVADHWTLEYDLAFCGLAEQVYLAANLAKHDGAINDEKKTVADVEATARAEFKKMEDLAGHDKAALCSQIYKLFHSGGASKPIAAQYLANVLAEEAENQAFDRAVFKDKLPRYIVDAIAYVSRPNSPGEPPAEASTAGNVGG